jgi:hypothetical protein
MAMINLRTSPVAGQLDFMSYHSKQLAVRLRARGLMFGVVSLMAASSASAQLKAPPGWKQIFDRGATPDTSFQFVAMPPGFHITTGPGVILFHPSERADGRYTVGADIVLFPNASDVGYGLFIGGQNLESKTGDWTAFVLRKDGAFRIESRRAGADHALTEWKTHPAIKAETPDGVTNRLRVRVAPDSIRFVVNDSTVATIGASGVVATGTFGFRVGEKVNLHITTLDVTRHIAPPRQR